MTNSCQKLTLLNLGRLTTTAAWRKPPHRHPFHQMIVLLKGRFHVAINGREITAHTGDVLFYPAHQEHRERIEPSEPPEFLYFGWTGPQPAATLCAPDRYGRIRALTEWLWWDYQNSTYPGRADVATGLLRAILDEYRRQATHREDALAGKVRAFVREHLREPLDLDRLAAVARMNKYTFLRRYRALTGTTPLADVRRIRAEAARELIITGNATLAVIAEQVGLADEHQLSRLVRKQFGVAPGYFRKP